MDNTALARFISSLGSFNNYGSTLAQTKRALDTNSVKPLKNDADDIAIFTDALKGIEAIRSVGFNSDGIIAINKQFDSNSDEEPDMPGHLRNSYYNEDDKIAILIDKTSQNAYFPPDIVSRNDLDSIVKEYKVSKRTESDAWRVFAKLAKLQPFQDGNKRTALIAANAAYGTLESGEYLVLPFNDLDRSEFTINLMRYYQAENKVEEEQAFKKMIATLPTAKERLIQLREPIKENIQDIKTYHVKPQFKTRKGKIR